jgi:hypothetical protein
MDARSCTDGREEGGKSEERMVNDDQGTNEGGQGVGGDVGVGKRLEKGFERVLKGVRGGPIVVVA